MTTTTKKTEHTESFKRQTFDFYSDLTALNDSSSAEFDHFENSIIDRQIDIVQEKIANLKKNSDHVAGLVSLSTTRTSRIQREPNEYGFAPLCDKSLDEWWAENTVKIDQSKARVSRLQKAIGVAAKWIDVSNSKRKQNLFMVTLTYKNADDWRADHMSKYISCVRTWYSRKRPGIALKYCWVAELQQRGAVHYHIIYWLDRSITMRKADKAGWWKHGSSNTEPAFKAVGYIMKYASKTDSKTAGKFPKGCRLYGVGGLGKEGRKIKKHVMLPEYVSCNASIHDKWARRKGGGFINKNTGQELMSEYVMIGDDHDTFLRVRFHDTIFARKNDKNADIQCLGPFSWLTDKPVKHDPFFNL